MRIDDSCIQFLAACVFKHLELESQLFDASIAAFRRQWNAILDRLDVPRRQVEGGATPLFRKTGGNGTRHTCVSVPFLLFSSRLLYRFAGRPPNFVRGSLT